MGAVFINNLNDRLATCIALAVVFGLWELFMVFSVGFKLVPPEDLPLEEIMLRTWPWPFSRIPAVRKRTRVMVSCIYVALSVALVVAWYLLWSWTVKGVLDAWPPRVLLEGPPPGIEFQSNYTLAGITDSLARSERSSRQLHA